MHTRKPFSRQSTITCNTFWTLVSEVYKTEFQLIHDNVELPLNQSNLDFLFKNQDVIRFLNKNQLRYSLT